MWIRKHLDEAPLIPMGRPQSSPAALPSNTTTTHDIFTAKKSQPKRRKTIHIYGDEGAIIQPRSLIKLNKKKANTLKEIGVNKPKDNKVKKNFVEEQDSASLLKVIPTKDQESPTKRLSDSDSVADSEEEMEPLTSSSFPSRSSTIRTEHEVTVNTSFVEDNEEVILVEENGNDYNEGNNSQFDSDESIIYNIDEDSAERINYSQMPTYHHEDEELIMYDENQHSPIEGEIESYSQPVEIELISDDEEPLDENYQNEMKVVEEESHSKQAEEDESAVEPEEGVNDNHDVEISEQQEEDNTDKGSDIHDSVNTEIRNISEAIIEENVTECHNDSDKENTPPTESNSTSHKRHRVAKHKSLADICNQTSTTKRVRVGLSKRVKVDSLHNYLLKP
ncbi:hypothetical protein DFJ63DRAFT_337999 [Scheffersomyces coipomensis]|uniref:uncharacterized protein n=1 Tax=Scheffersomyces coipomensis TaxID=1788519 RepID=UPI00315C76D5